MSSCEDVPAPGNPQFAPDEIVIYGVNLRKDVHGDISSEILVRTNWIVSLRSQSIPAGTRYEAVAAYGYAYEGHCYRFDRPRILMFTSKDAGFSNSSDPAQPAIGCGFEVEGYEMWRIRSDATVLELSSQIDTFQKLVLEANVPGRRPPNTYASEMMLAHRGGRLTGGSS